MRAEIKALQTPDVEDIDCWVPSVKAWSLWVRILAGPLGSDGEESFDLEVCSLAWVAAKVAENGILNGRHRLIVDHFDWTEIETYLRRRVSTIDGSDWNAVASKLSRIGLWEFEDYSE